MPEWCISGLVNSHIPTESELSAESSQQQYPLGTQLRKNGCLYRYSKAGAAMASGHQGFLKGNYYQVPGKAGNSATSGFEGAIYANIAIGATSFQIIDTDAAKNLYEDALACIYDSTNACYRPVRIIGNDVSDGTSTTCYIADPGFKYAQTTSFGITVYLSEYGNIRSLLSVGSTYTTAMGYALFPIQSGYYFWLQTAGRITGVTGASTWPGQTAYVREVYANTDGSLITGGADVLYQRVGHLLGRTASDYGDNCIMLQLDQ